MVEIRDEIQTAQARSVISCCNYPAAYIFFVLGIDAAAAMVPIQVGNYAFDIISKYGVGGASYQITYAQSKKPGLWFEVVEREKSLKIYNRKLNIERSTCTNLNRRIAPIMSFLITPLPSSK